MAKKYQALLPYITSQDRIQKDEVFEVDYIGFSNGTMWAYTVSNGVIPFEFLKYFCAELC